jgi:hypothetical protein
MASMIEIARRWAGAWGHYPSMDTDGLSPRQHARHLAVEASHHALSAVSKVLRVATITAVAMACIVAGLLLVHFAIELAIGLIEMLLLVIAAAALAVVCHTLYTWWTEYRNR